MQKKVLVSGIQSSGKLHIGNYFGAIKQNIELGNSGDYDSYIFIADYHSMTSLTNAQERREHTFDAVCTYLACGLDPNKVTLFKQSDVLSHTELAWILNTITPLPMLMLAHSFKDKIFKSLEEKIGQENNDKPAYKQFIIDHKNHYIHQLHALLIQSDSGDHIVSDIAKSYDIKVSEVRFLAQAMISVFDLTSNQINAGLFTYPALMAADI